VIAGYGGDSGVVIKKAVGRSDGRKKDGMVGGAEDEERLSLDRSIAGTMRSW